MLFPGLMELTVAQKALVWKSGFWGQASDGWWYEALYVAVLLVILTTGGGSLALI